MAGPRRTAAHHRTRRNVWIGAAAIELIAAIALHRWAPAFAPYLIGSSWWIWALIGAGYHAGWLNHDNEGNADD